MNDTPFMLRVKMPPELLSEFDLALARYRVAHPGVEDVTRSMIVRRLIRGFIAEAVEEAAVSSQRLSPPSKKDAYLQSLKEQS